MNMPEKFLTFEWDSKKAGLEYLIEQLSHLAKHSANDHIYLMVSSWGGDKLSEEKQNLDAALINHVKIYRW